MIINGVTTLSDVATKNITVTPREGAAGMGRRSVPMGQSTTALTLPSQSAAQMEVPVLQITRYVSATTVVQ